MSFSPVSGDQPDQSADSAYNPYGEGKCPECGIDLQSVDPKKHSVTHFGVDPVAYTPQTAAQTLLARQRQASLLSQEIPTR